MFERGDGLVYLEAAQALAVDVDDFVADAKPPVSGNKRKGERKLNNVSGERIRVRRVGTTGRKMGLSN